MAWYNRSGQENDIVISSRIRLARNLSDYPFESRLDKNTAAEVIEKIRESAQEYEFTDFDTVDALTAQSWVEKHYISPEFAKKSSPHAVLSKGDTVIMLCEEDHIRLQCIKPGLALEEAYQEASRADDDLCDKLNIAFDEKLGYLTHCPTNLGTGMRASVMVFLPALTMNKQISSIATQLPKLGLTIRGLYGEGSVSDGCLYQISNQVTLGISEEDIIKNLSETLEKILSYERSARERLINQNYDEICDTVYRALGTLSSAYMMSSDEFMKLFAYVRLGIACGMVSSVEYGALGEIWINSMPATLTERIGKDADSRTRDKERASYIRKTLCKK